MLVTGQDASDASLQRILAGNQTMSVYKAIKREAEAAAKVAIALSGDQAQNVKAMATASVDNGAGQVPAILLEPVVVTRDNIDDTVIADGFTTRERIKAAATPSK